MTFLSVDKCGVGLILGLKNAACEEPDCQNTIKVKHARDLIAKILVHELCFEPIHFGAAC